MNKTFKLFTRVIFLAITVILYGYFIGSKGLNIKEYSVINSKIISEYHGLKIVHFTDLHFGTTFKAKDLKILVEQINMLKPEIVVFTGDLIDKDYKISKDELMKLIEAFKEIDPVVSSYIIKGNHDISDEYEIFIKSTDFKFLDNSSELFYYNTSTPIQIFGLTDDVHKTFTDYNEELYSILLTHKPDNITNLNSYKPDLILAGHSHNGQVRIPLIGAVILPEGAKKYYDENYVLNNAEMFISGGVGTTKIPVRLFNKPSFNFYRLYNK